MIFYQLALQRLIDYFQLNKPSKEEETRNMLLHKKKRVEYKTVLKTDSTWNFYITILLSIIGILLCLSIPFAILETPCEIFVERKLEVTHGIAAVIDKYSLILDAVIILLILLLIYVSVKTVSDAIRRTNISISPWIEKGRYTLPPSMMTKKFKCTDEDNAEILERYRQRMAAEHPKNPFTWYGYNLYL